MKIFDGLNDAGKLHYFEISNSLVSRGRACDIVASIPGAEIIKRSSSRWADDVFCVFRLGDKLIEIWEPFGDNSRFHIGANPPGWCQELAQVREIFANEPAFRFRWLGRNQHVV